ncbi:MAG: type III pantothenate kinase [Muribaculaceae bacterium]|nr:type III pantothenate kinase [Muribaculaceae bacterium]
MSRIFTIDIGNTAAKGTLFDGYRAIETKVVDNNDPDSLLQLASEEGAEGAVFCSVRGSDSGFGERFRAMLDIPVMEVTSYTRLPFETVYSTPSTLGVDRIAAAAGVICKYGGNAYVVDAGTAVTADVVGAGKFLGGNISPGLRLRFRSLHAFTGKLPLVRPNGEMPAWGRDTETAIRCGVVGGLVAEIEAGYREVKKIYKDIQLIMTGGDADFLRPLLEEKGMECRIDHNLVGLGLVNIYTYNK